MNTFYLPQEYPAAKAFYDSCADPAAKSWYKPHNMAGWSGFALPEFSPSWHPGLTLPHGSNSFESNGSNFVVLDICPASLDYEDSKLKPYQEADSDFPRILSVDLAKYSGCNFAGSVITALVSLEAPATTFSAAQVAKDYQGFVEYPIHKSAEVSISDNFWIDFVDGLASIKNNAI